jgi:hypothetical protein
MDPLITGGILSGIGGIGSAAGGLLGAASQNRAWRQQRDLQKGYNAYGEHRIESAAYGMQNSAFLGKLFRALDEAVKSGDETQLLALQNSPEYAAYEKATGKPAMQQLAEMADQSDRFDAQTLTGYERDADQVVREATKYGTDQTKVVNDAAGLALKNANAKTMARLNSMGMGGSTILTDAMGANAGTIERGRAANVADIAGRATGYKTQALTQRAGGRSALRSSMLDRRNSLRGGIANTKLDLANNAARIWTGTNIPQPPGVSGLGSALAGGGNALGSIGGVLLGKALGKE